MKEIENMSIKQELSNLLYGVREKRPLVHHITNYVTVNDCANIVLAIGASPVMADEIHEVEDMVSIANALVLNLGTLNERTVKSMLVAGKKANELGIPVIFDPVGVGATTYRTEIASKIIDEVEISVISGNISEIKTIAGLGGTTKGVDASLEDMAGLENVEKVGKMARDLSSKLNCTIAITGAVDVITDGDKGFYVCNGHEMLSTITGTGCMCTSLIGSFCGVTDDYLNATTAGIMSMGIAGERAYGSLRQGNIGSGSFRAKLLDMVFMLTGGDLAKEGKVYEM